LVEKKLRTTDSGWILAGAWMTEDSGTTDLASF